MAYLKYIEEKPYSSYTQKMKDEMELVTISKKDMTVPFGSIVYRIQQFPGDLDLIEVIEESGSKKHALEFLVKGIQRIVKRIQKKKLHYYSEIKAGVDNRYNIDIGPLRDGIWYQTPNLLKIITKYYQNKLISDKDYQILKEVLKEQNADAYEVAYNVIREYRVLRWNADEILKGKKKVIGKTISLIDAVDNLHQLFKIDEIAIVQNKLAEVTNVYLLAYTDKKGIRHSIIDYPANIQQALRDEIEKLYYSDMFYNPFKVIKRIFALARSPLNQSDPRFINLIYILKGFVSSTTSLAYQIKSELEVIELLLEKIKSPPLVTINNSLDSIKFRLSSYLEISNDELEVINDLINQAIKANTKQKLELVDKIKKIIKVYINRSTITYLDKVELNPLPPFLLPKEHKYDRSIVRKPNSNPINPMKLFSK